MCHDTERSKGKLEKAGLVEYKRHFRTVHGHRVLI